MDKNFEKVSENARLEATFKLSRIQLRENRINPKNFKDCPGFSNEKIDIDIAKAEKLKNRFDEKGKEDPENQRARDFGEFLEFIINEQVELGNWLGDNVLTYPASEIDDYEAGVDSVAEILEDDSETSHFALAMDATIGGDSVTKLRRIKDEIDGGELGGIKYFHSERTGFKGSLKNVPRVVVAVDGETIKELASMWMSGDKKGLNSHKVQFQILKEIILQAEVFRDYASRVGKEEIAEQYGDLAERMQKIYDQKIQTAEVEMDDFDSAYNALKFNLKIFED